MHSLLLREVITFVVCKFHPYIEYARARVVPMKTKTYRNVQTRAARGQQTRTPACVCCWRTEACLPRTQFLAVHHHTKRDRPPTGAHRSSSSRALARAIQIIGVDIDRAHGTRLRRALIDRARARAHKVNAPAFASCVCASAAWKRKTHTHILHAPCARADSLQMEIIVAITFVCGSGVNSAKMQNHSIHIDFAVT